MDVHVILLAAAGLVLLFFGRRFFWLLVGVTGFLIGFTLVAPFVGGETEKIPIAAGVVAGIAGALLAIFLQKIAVLVGGFLAGGYVTWMLVRGLELSHALPDWAPFLVGGVIGAFLLKKIFDGTVLVLTSLLGATLVVGSFVQIGVLPFVLVIAVAIVGIVFQLRSKRKKKEDGDG
jgi:hypothetical protein